MGAPIGNRNATKGRRWTAAIETVLNEKHGKEQRQKLYLAAKRLVEKAIAGDVSALREIGDRIEGKPAQDINLNVENEFSQFLAALGTAAPEVRGVEGESEPVRH